MNYSNPGDVEKMMSTSHHGKHMKRLEQIGKAVTQWIDRNRRRAVVAPAEPTVKYFTTSSIASLDVDDIATEEGLVVMCDTGRNRTWSGEYVLNTHYHTDMRQPIQRLYTLGTYAFPVSRQGVKIEARFGYALEVPDAIREAANLMTFRLWKRPEAIFGVSGSPVSGISAVINKIGTDSDIQALLSVVPIKWQVYCG